MIYAQIPQKHLLATDVSDAIATCWFMAILMMNEAEQIVECLENDEGLSSGEAWKMGKLVNFFKNMETSWRNTADDLYILVEHYELRVDTQGSMISDDVRDRLTAQLVDGDDGDIFVSAQKVRRYQREFQVCTINPLAAKYDKDGLFEAIKVPARDLTQCGVIHRVGYDPSHIDVVRSSA
jgi:hypothetical protein